MRLVAEEARKHAVLVRHGATEWSTDRRHTGRTDIPLSPEGRRQAEMLRPALAGQEFAAILCSPLRRARETCHIVGWDGRARIVGDLQEWNYGDYEGKTTAEIRRDRPQWFLWRDGVPNGETLEEVSARADRVIEEIVRADGDVAIFSHGHFLRIVAARWIHLPPVDGERFALDTATVSVLGYEHTLTVVALWNDGSHLRGTPNGSG